MRGESSKPEIRNPKRMKGGGRRVIIEKNWRPRASSAPSNSDFGLRTSDFSRLPSRFQPVNYTAASITLSHA